MKEFFHGWRRKVGIATLLFSCVAMAGWLRSITTIDIVQVHVSACNVGGRSASGLFELTIVICPPGPGSVWAVGPFSSDSVSGWTTEKLRGTANLSALGFRHQVRRKWSLRTLVFPYWSLVLPMTLLSAYLLLSTPQPLQKSTAAV